MRRRFPRSINSSSGSFKFTVVKDGASIIEKPNGTFGTNQAPETVDKLLSDNFLPTDKFVNTYSPRIIDTGSDVSLARRATKQERTST